MIRIGTHKLSSKVVLAPMAGVTDLPFRTLCRQYGAGLAAGEMLTSNIDLWDSDKNRLRRAHESEQAPRIVQIAGSDPDMMAHAASMNVEHGAQIIDINMGCPAKKVLKKAAGSALLRDEKLVEKILKSVVSAVDVPVTLKIRTGWCPDTRNAPVIARIAEDYGIQALAVHGRTRSCMFKGPVEYDTIALAKETVAIPVFANGDITSPEKALEVLNHTRADGIMIGRGAQGRPWLFQEINHYLDHGLKKENEVRFRLLSEIQQIILGHIQQIHEFYGEFRGVLFARKHISWYLQSLMELANIDKLVVLEWRKTFNHLTSTEQQLSTISQWFSTSSSKQGSIAA